jgi:hypothetical protein
MIVGRPKGLPYAHSLRWSGVPRVCGCRDVVTSTGRLGRSSQSRKARAAAGLRRERERLRDEMGARQVVQGQLDARVRHAEWRLATASEQGGE